ncbi:MAG: biotin synthase BioB [Actinobacteria bacterium]|nr:biotin synthase BioB [Actinomycetota bacterium]
MLNKIEKKILAGGGITFDEALALTRFKGEDILDLVSAGNRVARHFKGNSLEICSIINARSHGCSEDCSFCAQSYRYNAGVRPYPMTAPEKILEQAISMEKAGAGSFSIVTSGRGISEGDLDKVISALILLKKETGLKLCASLGIIDERKALLLKEAGLSMYHHNLESPSTFFPWVCTTHTFEERVNTVKAAQKAGLRVCSGGIVGLGETPAQRVELAFAILDLGVDSVPVNFLHPIAGTPLEHREPPLPLACLQTLAIFRLVLPQSVIRLCGGRKEGLRSLQPLAFMAGANGVMIGDYLTTKGEDLKRDFQLFADLGLVPR